MKEEKRYNEALPLPSIQEETSKIEQIEEKKGHPILKKFLIGIILLFIATFIYGKTIGNKIIDIKEYKVASENIPSSWHGMKAIQFSDIHYGTSVDKKQLAKIINKINGYHPDIIFFTGDLIEENISINDETKKELINLLDELEPTLYKYAIYGNADLENKDYKEIMEQAGFILLENEAKLLYYEDEIPIEIIGFSPLSTNPNYTILTNFIEEQDTSSYYKIVLTHEPNAINKVLPYHPNMILAGHSLGGLIRPFQTPLFLDDNAKDYSQESYKINDTEIFISYGLGTTKYNIRLFNHPSINFYRFYTN